MDPDEPLFFTQFGLSPIEARTAVRALQVAGVTLESAHFHLRSNVPVASEYSEALAEMVLRCQEANFARGSLTAVVGCRALETILSRDAHPTFDMVDFTEALCSGVRAFWRSGRDLAENGRFVTGRAGVLVIRVIDIKDRPECVTLSAMVGEQITLSFQTGSGRMSSRFRRDLGDCASQPCAVRHAWRFDRLCRL